MLLELSQVSLGLVMKSAVLERYLCVTSQITSAPSYTVLLTAPPLSSAQRLGGSSHEGQRKTDRRGKGTVFTPHVRRREAGEEGPVDLDRPWGGTCNPGRFRACLLTRPAMAGGKDVAQHRRVASAQNIVRLVRLCYSFKCHLVDSG